MEPVSVTEDRKTICEPIFVLSCFLCSALIPSVHSTETATIPPRDPYSTLYTTKTTPTIDPRSLSFRNPNIPTQSNQSDPVLGIYQSATHFLPSSFNLRAERSPCPALPWRGTAWPALAFFTEIERWECCGMAGGKGGCDSTGAREAVGKGREGKGRDGKGVGCYV